MWCDVYLIADPSRAAAGELPSVVERALRGGVTAVQLREKDAPLARMLADAGALAQLSRAYGAAFLVNDRIDVALAADADGVHLGPDDMPVGVARRITPARMLVGFSAGTPGEARDAEKSGASYLGVGAVRRTSTKTDAGDPIGPCGVAEVRAVTRLPIVAIGGVRVQDVDELIAAGADGVAVASAILESSDPEAAAASFVRAVGTARTRYARAR